MSKAKITYHLSFPEAHQHYVDVCISIPSRQQETIIGMPVWTPGSYLVREFEKNMDSIEAVAKGKKIPLEKITKNQWAVRNRGADFEFHYKTYSFRQNVRESYVDYERATLNGANVFAYVKGHEHDERIISITPLAHWKTIDTALPQNGKNKHSFIARDYEQLVDSVFEIGNHARSEFEVCGVPHVMTIVGGGNWDMKRLVEDTTKIVEAARAIYGELPYKKYYFMLQTMDEDGYGGLEHCDCTLMTFPAFSFVKEKSYKRALALISHEYFHTWNVKRIHPVGISPFDWDQENYTELLWVSEGFTSYYDQLLLLRAGINSEEEYFDSLVEKLNRYMQTPGRLVQTVADSSHSTWIKLYRPDENSVNTTISYYLKGALIGLILDITIRVKSKLKYSLDDLMRKLWKDTKKEDYRGFDFKDIRRYSEELAGSDLGSFFRNHVFSTKEINFKKYFEMAGLSLSAVEEKKPLPYLGLKTVKEPESLYPQVVNVLRGSAADAAGFYSGDILVALNGARVKEISIAGQISDFNVDDEIAVTLFRNGFLKKIQVKLTEKPAFNFAISKGKTRGQKKAMRNMLLASAKGK